MDAVGRMIRLRLDATNDPLAGVARGLDSRLDPGCVSMDIDVPQHTPATQEFNRGVLQT